MGEAPPINVRSSDRGQVQEREGHASAHTVMVRGHHLFLSNFDVWVGAECYEAASGSLQLEHPIFGLGGWRDHYVHHCSIAAGRKAHLQVLRRIHRKSVLCDFSCVLRWFVHLWEQIRHVSVGSDIALPYL